MTDAELIAVLEKATNALDEEAAWLVDVDVNDGGQQRPSIPAHDQPYFDAVTEQAQGLRELIAMIEARRRAG
jgi:hypothetical protein